MESSPMSDVTMEKHRAVVELEKSKARVAGYKKNKAIAIGAIQREERLGFR